MPGQSGSIWYCVRRNGQMMRDGWLEGVELSAIRSHVKASPEEVIEVCVANDFQPVKLINFRRVFINRMRGLIGMEIQFKDQIVRLSPTRMIASNLSFERALEKILTEKNLSTCEFRAIGKLRQFKAEQYLLTGNKENETQQLFRGSAVVDAMQKSIEIRAADLADGIELWMTRNLSTTGELPYKYWPSRGEESPADNAIRRFLGSWTLARLGEYRNSDQIREAARLNLRHTGLFHNSFLSLLHSFSMS